MLAQRNGARMNEETQTPPPSRRRRSWPRRLALGMAIVGGLALLGVLLLQAHYFHRVRQYVEHNPQTTALIEDRRGAMRAAGSEPVIRQRWVAYERIAPVLVRAVVAAEDARFVGHGGVDYAAVREAWSQWREAGGALRGASTITQQLAKNLFLSERRSYLRKLQEAAIAFMLEASMDKRRILEIYLNVIEWGDGIHGIEAAARHFAGTSAAGLGRWQAARLAARIPRPRFYHRNGETTFLIRRALQIDATLDHVRIP